MLKIVLVEDEALLREGLLRTTPWQRYGYEVAGCAVDGEEGQRTILALQPDLVITDIRLPKLSGLDMIESLTGKASCDYVIISGHSEFSYAKRAISLGVKEYLLKPIDDAQLFDILEKFARTRQPENSDRTFSQSTTPAKSPGDRYFHAACEYMCEHFAENITPGSVAQALSISESYLIKLFKRKSDASFLEVLKQYRMQEAARLLMEGELKVYEIANKLGYHDTQYFSNLFRKAMGVNPSEYRRSLSLTEPK